MTTGAHLVEPAYRLVDAVDCMLAALSRVIGQGFDAELVAVDIGGDLGLFLHRLGYLVAAGGNRA